MLKQNTVKKTNFYFLLLFIFPFYLNAQLTINDMKMILKMDLDKFETFALKRGYAFNKIIDDIRNCIFLSKKIKPAKDLNSCGF